MLRALVTLLCTVQIRAETPQCDADAGEAFARMVMTKSNSSLMNANAGSVPFDCSRTQSARACAQSVLTEPDPDCACLTGCYSAAKLLDSQAPECVSKCKDPMSAQEICADWDDAHSFCHFYGVFQCVAVHAPCDAAKLQPSECESSCTVKSKAHSDPADQLDAFLQCLGECKPAADREERAARLENSVVVENLVMNGSSTQ